MKTIVIMIGIPGSGKSTFCNTKFPLFVRVNLDTLHTRNKESILINESIKNDKDIIIDNTNPTINDRAKYISIGKENNYKIIGYYMESKFESCMERNNLRKDKEKLPYKALASIAKQLEQPSFNEGFDELYYVKIVDGEFVIDEWRKDDEL